MRITYRASYFIDDQYVETEVSSTVSIHVEPSTISATPRSGIVYVAPSINNEVIAEFTVPAAAKATDFVATIDWGGGSGTIQQGQFGSRAEIVGSGTQFYVVGNHHYSGYGKYKATIRIMDTGAIKNVATVVSNIEVADAIAGTIASLSPIQFKYNPRPSDKLSINWGDGGSSSGAISGGDIKTGSGSHRYTAPGTYTFT